MQRYARNARIIVLLRMIVSLRTIMSQSLTSFPWGPGPPVLPPYPRWLRHCTEMQILYMLGHAATRRRTSRRLTAWVYWGGYTRVYAVYLPLVIFDSVYLPHLS